MRSFSIWTRHGLPVWDSGDELEQRTLARYPASFNASNKNDKLDDRSDDKGPEPESVVVGQVFGHALAFVALERIGGVIVYDVSVPWAPRFVIYANNRAFGGTPTTAEDLGPEGLVLVPADESPTGQPLLIVANEVSGSVTLWGLSQP